MININLENWIFVGLSVVCGVILPEVIDPLVPNTIGFVVGCAVYRLMVPEVVVPDVSELPKTIASVTVAPV